MVLAAASYATTKKFKPFALHPSRLNWCVEHLIEVLRITILIVMLAIVIYL